MSKYKEAIKEKFIKLVDRHNKKNKLISSIVRICSLEIESYDFPNEKWSELTAAQIILNELSKHTKI